MTLIPNMRLEIDDDKIECMYRDGEFVWVVETLAFDIIAAMKQFEPAEATEFAKQVEIRAGVIRRYGKGG